MRLSTKGKYGLYAMAFLARQADAGPRSLKEIAASGIPRQYLEQLLGSLRRAGLVTTVRGAQGGYQLSRPAADITVLDIIDATEGPVSLSECLNEDTPCGRMGSCPVRGVWQRLTDSINDLLRGVRLSDFMNEPVSAPASGAAVGAASNDDKGANA